MKAVRKRLKKKALSETIEIKATSFTLIKTIKEFPLTIAIGKEPAKRICAHDLFAIYTADIIKENVFFIK